MAIDPTAPSQAPIPQSAASSKPPTTTDTSSAGGGAGGIADNFQSFLTLLTTQLQNQNPLDPLDTNQFTQQLVQFAGVEQQLKTNDELSQLVTLQQTTQATQALGFVGKTAVVNGSTTALSNSQAAWQLNIPTTSTVTITIANSKGQTVFTGNYSANAGDEQPFTWNGQGNDGTQWPDGQYTMTATAQDSTGNSVAISTEIAGTVNSVDLTQSPPLLSIQGQNYTISQIKRIGT